MPTYWAMFIAKIDADTSELAALKLFEYMHDDKRLRIRVHDANFEPLQRITLDRHGKIVEVEPGWSTS